MPECMHHLVLAYLQFHIRLSLPDYRIRLQVDFASIICIVAAAIVLRAYSLSVMTVDRQMRSL